MHCQKDVVAEKLVLLSWRPSRRHAGELDDDLAGIWCDIVDNLVALTRFEVRCVFGNKSITDLQKRSLLNVDLHALLRVRNRWSRIGCGTGRQQRSRSRTVNVAS